MGVMISGVKSLRCRCGSSPPAGLRFEIACIRLCAIVWCVFPLACSEPPASAAVRGRPEARVVQAASDDWAHRVGQPVLPRRTPSPSEMKIAPPTIGDSEYASREPVSVRRIVYRFTLIVPAAMKSGRPPVAVPAGELHIDATEQRLRARFIGPGWPIDEGSEVRLRVDAPGAYLFDGEGGRPLPPGQLASWFLGGSGLRARGDLQMRYDYGGAPNEGPGDMLCALLAEWTQNSREETQPRCAGAIPPGFRFGAWQADLTALVPISLPRSDLRADAANPPAPLPTSDTRDLLEAEELGRIAPTPLKPSDEANLPPAAVSGKTLRIENRTPARLCVIVQGIPIGWIKPDVVGDFAGLAPGVYRVAAQRSSGLVVLPPTLMRIPGEVRLGREVGAGAACSGGGCRANELEPQLGASSADSPAAAR
jgi:hypothetical protein